MFKNLTLCLTTKIWLIGIEGCAIIIVLQGDAHLSVNICYVSLVNLIDIYFHNREKIF